MPKNMTKVLCGVFFGWLLATGGWAQEEPEWFTGQEVDEKVQEALEEYRLSRRAATVQKSTRAIWPFDQSQPELVCSPDYVCMVELQPGEIVAEDAGGIGDSLRWNVHNVTSPGDPPTVHVLFKPMEFGLRTNAVIVTDRRTYHLTLKSQTQAEINAGKEYVRHASFYYPADFVMRFKQQEARTAKRKKTAAPAGAMAAAKPSDLRFNYRIEGKKKVPFVPQTVFDDGARTFLRFSSRLATSDLPTVLASQDGKSEAVNFHWNEKQTLVVDGLYEHLKLVIGTGKARKVVDVYRSGS